MDKDEFLNELAVILEEEENTLTGDEVLEELPGWDSLSVISFIALVDEKFNFIISGDQIKDAQTINDLTKIVETHFSN